MKLLTSIATLFCALFLPAFAITDADLTPAALAGKTLTFTIVNGTTPFATTGSFSGTFGATPGVGGTFNAANITGNTVNVSTTQTAISSNTGFIEITLAKFIEGRAPAVLTLYYTDAGVGGYEIFITGLNGASVNGTFVIGAPALPKLPEIGITSSLGKKLSDGSSTAKFGSVTIGKSIKQSYTIKNTGSGKLTGLGLALSGTNKSDFAISPLTTTSLAPGASAKFAVAFKPKSKGSKVAAIRVTSNDANESKFDVALSGTAVSK